MRVIHEGTRASCNELVDEGLADRNLLLIEATHPIHTIRQALAMPVNGGVLRQPIGHEDAHAVAFDHFNSRTRALSVVAPQMGFHARGDFANDRFGDEMEFLDALVHPPR